MYCVKCGVKLADTEKKCPLCGTVVYHPEISQPEARPLYPKNKMPEINSGSKALNGVLIILFLIPMIICLIADLHVDGRFEWSGYVIGAVAVAYVILALPLWFRRPNPVIFVPCGFAAVGLYLLYINLAVGGDWFLSFAFPVTGFLGVLTTAVVTLVKYIKKGRLYIFGGAFMALGGFMLLMEYLMSFTFGIGFTGWSVYPLAVMVLFGGLLFYLAINTSAREMMERKLFF